MRYVNASNERQILPWAHLDIAPGEEFETERDLSSNHNFVRVTRTPRIYEPEPVRPAIKED